MEGIVEVPRSCATADTQVPTGRYFCRQTGTRFNTTGLRGGSARRDRQCGREGDGMPRCMHHGFRTNRPGFVAMTSVL